MKWSSVCLRADEDWFGLGGLDWPVATLLFPIFTIRVIVSICRFSQDQLDNGWAKAGLAPGKNDTGLGYLLSAKFNR